MDKLIFHINSDLILSTQVHPKSTGIFEWKKESGKIYYKKELKDDLKFYGNDYNLLIQFKENECLQFTITIDKLCDGNYRQEWTGIFSIFDSTINEDECWIKIKPKSLDVYKCIEDGIKVKQNIFNSGSSVIVTSIAGILEEDTCIDLDLDADCTDYENWLNEPYDGCLSDPSEWCLKEHIVLIEGLLLEEQELTCQEIFDLPGAMEIERQTTWHREVLTTDCIGGVPQEPQAGSGWTLLNDDCIGSNTADWWRCPGIGSEPIGDYTRGRTLENVLQTILDNMDCGLSVKSDFFNINPVGNAPANVAYLYALNNLHNLTIHHKSDIKNKNGPSFTTSLAWDIKPNDFFEDFLKLFNVWYIIEDSTLVLEHYSFFTGIQGLDLSQVKVPLQFDYKANEDIKIEEFDYSDDVVSSQFTSLDITYSCGEETKEQRCKLFNTDLAYIENNPDNISNDGFVIIANDLFESNLVIIDNNLPLAWPNLHENLHRHGRLFKSGTINNIEQDFLSWFPYIKQEQFSIDLCCNEAENFNPQHLITTSEGQNEVEIATYNALSGKLQLELKK